MLSDPPAPASGYFTFHALFDLDLSEILTNLFHLGLAYVITFPIGWDRERASRSAGLRTFPLVAVASCGFMLTGMSVFEDPQAQARIAYGIISGIGFIGGGAILKTKGSVLGTATAASIWCTGAIGLTVAYGLYEIALSLSLINFLSLRYGRLGWKQEKGIIQGPDEKTEWEEE